MKDANQHSSQRGVFFSLDALFALFITMSFVVLLSLLSVDSSAQDLALLSMHTEAADAIDVMAKITLGDISHEPIARYLFTEQLFKDKDRNKTLLDVIGTLWVTNDTQNMSLASNVSQLVGPLLPGHLNWAFLIDNDTIYNSSPLEEGRYVTGVSRRFASGYKFTEPVVGYVSRAYLSNLKGKQDAAYVFFGGFVGQGNLTTYIRDIPANSTIEDLYVELSLGSDSSLFINDVFCYNLLKTGGAFSVDNWSLSFCTDSIVPGAENKFTLLSLDENITNQYVGGGFIKVVYNTGELGEQITNKMRYYFPGIAGVVNLYDSFYVPGDISAATARLHFTTTGPIYFTIGNVTVYNLTTFSGTVDTIIPDANITAALFNRSLTYADISKRTVPLRVGHYSINMSNESGDSDTILSTERAHTMELMDIDGAPNMTRLEVAMELDKIFIDDILVALQNRVGLVSFHENVPPGVGWTTDLTNDAAELKYWVDKYTAGATPHICYTCPIVFARNMLMEQSNETRVRAIVMMSDGHADKCDYNPNCQTNNIPLRMQRAREEAIYQACNTYENTTYNYDNTNFIKIYTIGFGNGADNETLKAIANCTNATFYSSNNLTELIEIYKNISAQINRQVYFSRQLAFTTNVNSTLYPDSYIEFTYTPEVPSLGYREITVAVETPRFPSCEGDFFIPAQFNVSEIRGISYSADYWSDNLSVMSPATGGIYSQVYNLADYGPSYMPLGDPFSIQFSPLKVQSGATNTVYIDTGSSPNNASGTCSTTNRVIYAARFTGSVPFGPVLPALMGHNVTVYYDIDHDGLGDGVTYVSYGESLPGFDPTPVDVSELDADGNALDEAFLRLLEQLNFVVPEGNSGLPGSANNPIDLEISSQVNTQVSSLAEIPYMWGPMEMGVAVWR